MHLPAYTNFQIRVHNKSMVKYCHEVTKLRRGKQKMLEWVAGEEHLDGHQDRSVNCTMGPDTSIVQILTSQNTDGPDNGGITVTVT